MVAVDHHAVEDTPEFIVLDLDELRDRWAVGDIEAAPEIGSPGKLMLHRSEQEDALQGVGS
ncbi:MAG: hypothetical protein ACR2KW_02550 [Rubrobacter sp.]